MSNLTSQTHQKVTIAGIDLSSFTCNPGYEIDGGLFCYPRCRPGYSAVSFLCWSTCNQEQVQLPDGRYILRNTGDDWRDDLALCGKRLYDRGVGTIPDACYRYDQPNIYPFGYPNPNKSLFVGLCYENCTNGRVATTWAPTTCADPCPPNTTEGGFANCTKQNSYGRGVGDHGRGCPVGYQNWGLFCVNWTSFSFRGYVCHGNCPMYPVDRNYGRSSICSENDRRDRPWAYVVHTDPFGGIYSYSGCIDDRNNPGSFEPAREPSYYYRGDGLPQVDGQDMNGGSVYPPWYGALSGTKMPQKDLSGNPVGTYFNTRRGGVPLNNGCQENWGTLCYPRCDIGFNNAACCLCSPSCGGLEDHGATCKRNWNDRGVGVIPNGCENEYPADPDKIYEELLCYTKCKRNFASFATTCTRRGCPYGGIGETPLVCSKSNYYRGLPQLAVPGVGNKLNSKINIGALKNSLERIIINAIFILCCLIAAIFILSTSGLLRSKTTKVH